MLTIKTIKIRNQAFDCFTILSYCICFNLQHREISSDFFFFFGGVIFFFLLCCNVLIRKKQEYYKEKMADFFVGYNIANISRFYWPADDLVQIHLLRSSLFKNASEQKKTTKKSEQVLFYW